VIKQPTPGSQWINGEANPVLWRKGVADGIHSFDVELVRLSGGRLILIAKHGECPLFPRNVSLTLTPICTSSISIVPEKPSSFLLFLDAVPPGDDYFLVFINSTHGVRYATSPRLTILSATPSVKQTPTATISSVLTLTARGTPRIAGQFATTVAAVAKNGVYRSFGGATQAWAFGSLMAGCLVGVLWG